MGLDPSPPPLIGIVYAQGAHQSGWYSEWMYKHDALKCHAYISTEISNAQGVHEGLGSSLNEVSYELLSESFVDMRHELSNAQGVLEGSGSSLSLICVTNYCMHHQLIYE